MWPSPTCYLSRHLGLFSAVAIWPQFGVCVMESGDHNPSAICIPSAPSSTCTNFSFQSLILWGFFCPLLFLCWVEEGVPAITCSMQKPIPWMNQSFLGPLPGHSWCQVGTFLLRVTTTTGPLLGSVASLIVKILGSAVSQTWVGILALLLTCCVQPGKSNNSTSLSSSLKWGLLYSYREDNCRERHHEDAAEV